MTELVIVNGKQRKLRWNEVVVADGSVKKLSKIRADELLYKPTPQGNELYQPVIDGNVIQRYQELHIPYLFTSGFLLTGASLVTATIFADPLWAIVGSFGGLLGSIPAMVISTKRKKGKAFERYIRSKQVTAFVSWVKARYGIDISEIPFDSLLFFAKGNSISVKKWFRHDNNVYTMEKTAEGLFYLEKEVVKDASVLSNPQLETLKNNVEEFVFSGEVNALHTSLLKRLNVVSNHTFSVENSHVVSRVTQDLQELTKSLHRLTELGVQQLPESVTKVLEGLNEELQIIIDSEISAVISGLDSQADWVSSRELITGSSNEKLVLDATPSNKASVDKQEVKVDG